MRVTAIVGARRARRNGPISAVLSDRRGTSFVQMLILVAAMALAAVAATKAVSVQIAEKLDCTGQAISGLVVGGGPCQATSGDVAQLAGGAAPGPTDPILPIEDVEGPALEGAGPIRTLPFPGTLAVTCTAVGAKGDQNCKDQTGVRVQVTGEAAIERTPTKLDINGCPKQELSINTKLQVELSGKAKGKTLGGTLAIFTGQASKFKVTVSPETADAISRGEGVPNPIDPTSIRVGDTIELAEEFFAGHKLQGTYRNLQAELGFEEGRRLSTAVRRIDERTLRIFVGDAEFVRQAASLGLTAGEFAVALGNKSESSNGNLRAVDIDIGTAAGFEAYQRFLAEGRLPPPNAPGTSDPTSAETIDFSDSQRIEAKIGRLKLGGLLGDSEGRLTETRHQDGTLDTVVSARLNDVGVVSRTSEAPDGTTTKSFSLLIEGADPAQIEKFELFTGRPVPTSSNGNIRFDFTEDDLRRFQEQALDQLVQRARDQGSDISRDELARLLREDPARLERAGLNDTNDLAFEIATAPSPEEVLRSLFALGGAGGSGAKAFGNLVDFLSRTSIAQNGPLALPKENPETLLPGTIVAPTCN